MAPHVVVEVVLQVHVDEGKLHPHKRSIPAALVQFTAEMAEWSKALDLSLIHPDLKVFKFSRESVGSNPTFGITFCVFLLMF